jgi:hypothetical protein
LLFAILIFVLVAYVAITRCDVPGGELASGVGRNREPASIDDLPPGSSLDLNA